MNSTVKIVDTILQVFLVFMPCHLIDADSCSLLELVKARSEKFDIDVMQQGSELEITAHSSRLTHTVQSAGPSLVPAQCPGEVRRHGVPNC
jgi:hypothetical protein